MAKVLVVDDQDTYRRYLKLELEDEGHEVKTASSGHEAIDVGTEFKPDVLVVDWMLKDEYDGLDVTNAIRDVNPGLKTVMITGYPSAELKQKAAQSRIARFVKKPFTLADIVENVRAVLNG
jgi:two-component system OmpR family response regulator